MKKPDFLRPNDLIAVVAPAGKVVRGKVQNGISLLRQTGFSVAEGENLFGSYFQFSGTDSERLSDLQSALDNPDVKAVFFARGGYGTIRLVEQLDFDRFAQNPKWLVGFSDITALHNVCASLKIPSVHGQMVASFVNEKGQPAESFRRLIRTLEGQNLKYRILSCPENRNGTARAPLVGGNLALIYSLMGTKYDLNTDGKILFIEDIGEYFYQIDRMMTSLRLSGKLAKLKGLVVGHFTDLKDNAEPFGISLREIVLHAVRDYNFPVCFGFPAGHEEPNYPLILGSRWKLKIDSEETIFEKI